MKKPTPATVLASMALFFSLGGAAVAAQHYMITSIRQIKPSVRRQLRAPVTLNSTTTTTVTTPAPAPAVPNAAATELVLTHYDTYIPFNKTTTVSCPKGYYAISGGYLGVAPTSSYPTEPATGWTFTLPASTSSSGSLEPGEYVSVTCQLQTTFNGTG